MERNKMLDVISIVLLTIGGINWGLVGLFSFNLVELLPTTLIKWAYILIGVSGVYSLYFLLKQWRIIK